MFKFAWESYHKKLEFGFNFWPGCYCYIGWQPNNYAPFNKYLQAWLTLGKLHTTLEWGRTFGPSEVA